MLDHLKEIDYGTPARESEREVTLEIDGQEVTVPAGTSLMRASTAARMSDVPAGTVTSWPSISSVTSRSDSRAGVP